jgi:hypothetical protein
MFTPWNLYVACFVTGTGRITGDRANPCSRGDFIPLGPAPWNHVCSIKFRNMERPSYLSGAGTFERYPTVPLGFCYCSKKFSQNLHQHRVSGAFLCLFW